MGNGLSFAGDVDRSYALVGTSFVVGRGSNEIYRLAALFDGECNASRCHVDKNGIANTLEVLPTLVAADIEDFPVETPGSLAPEVVAEVVNKVGVLARPVCPFYVVMGVGKAVLSKVGRVPSPVFDKRTDIF